MTRADLAHNLGLLGRSYYDPARTEFESWTYDSAWTEFESWAYDLGLRFYRGHRR